ncbi:PadR family transcriptional regulator [Roseivirga sp.]|uniref:PadR family transcriptional regulator n=1 Tax=Roseivirga sp. TaxID=1964215 RepID=UPI003B8CB20E
MIQENISQQEEIVLLAVGSLEPEAYAYGLQLEIKTQVKLSWSIGTIHTILYRLEKKGLLDSEMGGASQKRGGRSKRLYKLSSKGLRMLEQIQFTRQSMWANLSTNRH